MSRSSSSLVTLLLCGALCACDESTLSRPGADAGDADGGLPPPARDGMPGADADGSAATGDGALPVGAAFVVGYNFGGAGTMNVTLDGRTLSAQGTSGASSLRLTPLGGALNAWDTSFAGNELVPPVDAELAKLLNRHISVGQGGLQIEQGLTNGTYQLYTYHLENNAQPPRAFDVAVQGSKVTAAPLQLAQYHWVRFGPHEAQVTDGVLRIELQRVSGDASIFGLELFSTTGGRVQDLPAPPDPPGWTLVWSEEFSTPGLPDPAKWDYEEGYVRNSELQYYTRARSENARVENGTLILEARQDDFDGHAITSASVITKGKHEFRYGRVEVRAQLPAGLGVWPAIWTLGANIDAVGWPRCGEIDIMEYVGFQPDTIHGTVHMTDPGGAHTARGDTTTASAPHAGFHVYAIEWFSDRIDFYFDDTKYFTFNRSEPNTVWAFDTPHYLLLNLAFGGSWGGQQGVDQSILPVRFTIDYVRIYEQSP